MDILAVFNNIFKQKADTKHANPQTKIAPNKSVELHGKPMLMFWLEAVIAIAILVLISVGPTLMLDGQQAQTISNHELDLQVNAVTKRFSQFFTFYYETLRGLGTDPLLAQLVKNGDTNAIAARERVLERSIPGALRVRLLKPEQSTVDLRSNPPLSYASLELLRVAKRTVVPPPLEIHLTKRTQIYLVGAVSIQDETGHVSGLLHLTLNATALRDEVTHFGSKHGQVALQQLVDKKPVTLFVPANPIAFDGLHPLASSQLQLAYWYKSNIELPLFMSRLWIVIILAIVCGMVLGIQYWRLLQAITADQAVLLNLFAKNNKAGLSAIFIKECVHIAEAFIQQADMSSLGRAELVVPLETEASDLPGGELSVQSLIDEIQAKTVNAAVINKRRQTGSGQAPTADDNNLHATSKENAAALPTISIPEIIFRTHDIRGIVGKSITPAIAREIGRAIGSQLQEQGQQTISVARDARASGAELSAALIDGLVASGRDVLDLGVMPTPILYFATRFLDSDAGVMVSVGRSPKNYNGFKILINGDLIMDADIQTLQLRMQEGPLWEGMGSFRNQDILPSYVERIVDDVVIARPMKVVIDCGNGCAGLVAPKLFQELGCNVVELFCDLDGSYPNHLPDPSQPENLKALQALVLSEQADIGLAFDAEGDRLGVIDSQGRIIWPDRVLMLLAADVLARSPGGDIIFDVNCSRALANQVLENGGRPVMWQSGHAALKAKLRDTQALLAGEWGGHIIFQERWYGFDDACYAGARLLEILAVDARSSAEVFDDFPETISTPEYSLLLPEGEHLVLIESLKADGQVLSDARIVTVDGLRAEYEDGWGLVRVSNTSSALKFRFEANNEAALERIQGVYRQLLATVAPQLKPPF